MIIMTSDMTTLPRTPPPRLTLFCNVLCNAQVKLCLCVYLVCYAVAVCCVVCGKLPHDWSLESESKNRLASCVGCVNLNQNNTNLLVKWLA